MKWPATLVLSVIACACTAPERALCPETPMSMARKMGKKPRAVPLGKLPPAQTFMAVDRRIDHCPAPLTLTDYRNPRRR